MRPSNRSPSYIIRNPHGYCFRMVVPKDLRKFVRKTELRYSLKTGYLNVAKNKARLVAGQVQLIFSMLRKGGMALDSLSDDQIQKLVHQYIKESIEGWDRNFYEEPEEDHLGNPPFMMLDVFEDIRDQLIEGLNLGNFNALEQPINDLLERNGLDKIDKSSLEYRKLCAEVYKAQIQLMPMHERHMLCDFSYQKELPDIFPEVFEKPPERISQTHQSTSNKGIEKESDLLSEVIRNYVAEKEKNSWSEKSKQENKSSLNLFLEITGDVPIRSINRRTISKFKATLQKLPPNMNKVKKYREKSVQELLHMDIDKTLSVRTINKTLTRVGSLFKYALQEGFIDGQNPATGMNLPLDKFEDENRAPFTTDDLEKLMLSNEYINDKHGKSYQFWTPILALFTGMRQDEIAQLHLEDIRQDEEGIWLIDVNNRGDKKVKTRSAIRLVPVHPFIINELKLPEYVETLKGQGETRLFPELKKGRDGFGKSVSQWFNLRYKVRCDIIEDTDGRKKDFHSFRNTLINHLQRKNAPYLMLKQVVGHSKGKDVTQTTYTEKYTPKELLENVVSKIDFGINLRHLKNSRFVSR